MSNSQSDIDGSRQKEMETQDGEEQYREAAPAEVQEEQPVSEYEAAESGQSPTLPQAEQPAMSPEQTLLLQVLRRAKRQQDLIMRVQKSLKALSSVEKQVTRTADQIKQLQSAAKETQRQVLQAQRQIVSVEKRVQKVASKKVAAPKRSAAGKKKSKKRSRTKRR